jgi:hypothetical protein
MDCAMGESLLSQQFSGLMSVKSACHAELFINKRLIIKLIIEINHENDYNSHR